MKAPVTKKKGGAIIVAEDPELAEVETPSKPEPKPKAVTTSGVEIVDELDDGLSGPAVANEQRQAAASSVASISDDENLDIVFLEELFDYPVIGSFNFRDRFGVSKIRKHQRFTVPKHVAMVLLDRRLVTIPQFAAA